MSTTTAPRHGARCLGPVMPIVMAEMIAEAGAAHCSIRVQHCRACWRGEPECLRHHIARAMAELASYLSIVPHMWSFDVPPKHSAPLTRGLFCAAQLPALRERKKPRRRAGLKATGSR